MFSLILPVYNEKDNLSRNFQKILDELSGTGEGYEVIITEDGSTDGTRSLANSLAKIFKHIRVSHSENRLGKGLAIKRAFAIAKGDKVGFMDIDLSAEITQLGNMLNALGIYDIVVASRLKKRNRAKRKLTRYLFSVAYNLIIRLLFRSVVRDHQCGLKVFRRDVLRNLVRKSHNNRWFFDSEILILAQGSGFSIKEFPVLWKESRETKVGIRVIFQMIVDISIFFLKPCRKSRHNNNKNHTH